MAESIPEYLKKLFRVCHEDGSVIQGFDDTKSAKADAAERNKRAEKLGLSCRYTAGKKPLGV